MRAVPLEAVQREIDAIVTQTMRRFPDLAKSFLFEGLGSRPGPAGHDDRYYAEAALTYTMHLGESHVLSAVAADLGISTSQARDLVAACRRKGFLTPTTRGKRGGALTLLAHEALRDVEE
jgi:hypothetical protein